MLKGIAGILSLGFVLVLLACGGPTDAVERAPADEPTAPPPSGTAGVTGTITFEGEIPRLNPISMDADPGCAIKHDEPVLPEVLVLGEGNTMANVLVRIKSGLPEARWPVPSEAAVMDQEGCKYIPHVIGIRAGQTLRILNSDGLLHNVHALPKVNQEFNMAMPASRTEAERVFDRPELPPFQVKCDVHPWMTSYIAVMDHPHFSVTEKDGGFTISGIPAGTYEVEAWHEVLGTQSTSVTVADGETATADFTFSR